MMFKLQQISSNNKDKLLVIIAKLSNTSSLNVYFSMIINFDHIKFLEVHMSIFYFMLKYVTMKKILESTKNPLHFSKDQMVLMNHY